MFNRVSLSCKKSQEEACWAWGQGRDIKKQTQAQHRRERALQIFRGLLGTGGPEMGLGRCGLSPVQLSVLVLLLTMEWAVPVQVCRPVNGDSASYLCWSGFLLGPTDQNLASGGGTLYPVSKKKHSGKKAELSSCAWLFCFLFKALAGKLCGWALWSPGFGTVSCIASRSLYG